LCHCYGGDIYQDKINKQARERFYNDTIAAVKHSQPNLRQLTDIAEISGINSETMYYVFKDILREILVGKNKELEPHQSLIEGYITKYEEQEPFEGIPTETRIHLERLSESLADTDYSLEPLTMQIRRLVSVYEKEKKQLKRYTVGSFIIGIVAIIIAIYTYINPR